MVGVISAVGTLVLSVGILQLGTGLFGTFLSVRMDLEGFSPFTIGLIGSAYFGGFISGSLFCDRLISRVGHIRTFAACAAVICCATIAHSFLVDPRAWGLLRLMQGFCVAGLFLVAESWLNAASTNRIRGQVFAFYMIVNYVALGGGQFLLGLADLGGPTLFMLAALLYALCLVPVALSRAANPGAYERRQFGLRRLLAISPLGAVACMAVGAINGAFYGLAPVSVLGLGFDAEVVARFMGLAILFGLALQWPLGKLSDIFDRRKILIAMTFSVALAAVAIVLAGDRDPMLLLALAAVYGSTIFTVYPLAVAHANDFIDSRDVVPLTAGLLLAYGVGAVVGPTLAAGASELFGPMGVFAFIAATAAALGLFGLYRSLRRSAVPNEDQGRFVLLPRTSPAVADLAPQAEISDAEVDDLFTRGDDGR